MTTFGKHIYDDAQIQIARDTALIVRQFKLWTIPETAAICTRMVETSLRDIWHGDTATTTSRGPYQQKDDWVPPYLRNTDLDPRHSTAGATFLFLYGGYSPGTGGLLSKDWVNQPIGVTCQQVQGSAFPDRYNEYLLDAHAMVLFLQTDAKMQAMLASL